MLSILNFLFGYVFIEVYGAYPERFLNLLAQNGISFWHMQRLDVGKIRICMSLTDYLHIRPFARRAMCHLHIIKKVGFPFFTRKFRKRIALVIGLALFCLIAWVLTSFIWVIDIHGCENVDPALVREHLKNNGVYFGAYAKSIDHADLKNDILLNIPELSFITVNINGSHAEVTVRERSRAPEIISYETPSNIVADRGGIITSITVTSGTPEVQAGDTVTEGQLLASGYMTGRAGTTLQMRAIAEIRARTWQTLCAAMPTSVDAKTYTGETKTRRVLVFGHSRINLSLDTGNPYAECDKIIKTVRLTLPGNLELPIALETQVFYEYQTTPVSIDADTLFAYISERMEQYIELSEKDTLLGKQFENKTEHGAALVTLTAECEQSIGREQIIPKGE